MARIGSNRIELFMHESSNRTVILKRFVYFAGILGTIWIILYGFKWPSLFTVFAFFSLPAPFVLAYAVVKPEQFESKKFLSRYGIVCMVIGIASCIFVWGDSNFYYWKKLL